MDWKKREDMIVSTGYELICTCGVNKVSLPKVAKRSGFALGTIYRHFRSIDELNLTICINRLINSISRQNFISHNYSDPYNSIMIQNGLRIMLNEEPNRIIVDYFITYAINRDNVTNSQYQYLLELIETYDRWYIDTLKSCSIETCKLYDAIKACTRGYLFIMNSVDIDKRSEITINSLETLAYLLVPIKTDKSFSITEITQHIQLVRHQYLK